jgi:hypothetical protein
MRRLPLTLLVCAFSASIAAAQEPTPWANKFFSGKAAAPPPIILHDFGPLPKGTIKTYQFNMTNIYAVTMNVQEPKSPCGCMSVLKYTASMGPRETGVIEIKVDTSRIDGYKTIQMPVRFEGRDAKTKELFWSYAKLEIRFVSRQDIAINPGNIQFGVVAKGQKASQFVNVFYSGRQQGWKITDVEYKKELMDVQFKEVAARGGVAYLITATLKANAPAGAIDEQIVLKTNDKDANSAVLNLAATAVVQPPLSLHPGDLMKIGPVEVGKKVERAVLVRSDKDFKVTKVEGQGDGISVPLLPLAADKSRSLSVTFAPTKTGPVKKILTITTDTGESVSLTVEAVGTEPQQ